MDCKNCSTVLHDSWVVCPKCGTKVGDLDACTRCHLLITYPSPSFCPFCGHEQGQKVVPDKKMVSPAKVKKEEYVVPSSQVAVIKDSLLFKIGATETIEKSSKYNVFAIVSILLFMVLEVSYSRKTSSSSAYFFIFADSSLIHWFLGITLLSQLLIYNFVLRMNNNSVSMADVTRFLSVTTMYGTIGVIFKYLVFWYLIAVGEQGSSLNDTASSIIGMLVMTAAFAQFVMYLRKELRLSIGASFLMNFILFTSVFMLRSFLPIYLYIFNLV